MAITRIVNDLIDADVATFNRNYKQRILKIIQDYGHIIEQYGTKENLTQADKDLLHNFETNLLLEQEDFSISESEYKKLKKYIASQVKIFDDSPLTDEEKNAKTDKRLGKFIYHHIECMEKIFPNLLRKVYWYANVELIKELIARKLTYNKSYLGLGSNRQAFGHDDLNKRERGTSSIFTDLDALSKLINTDLDAISLTDLYQENIIIGDHFRKILAGENPSELNIFDDSKVNIIYMFGHRMSSENPAAEGTINLWDDHDGILKNLTLFFETHPELLPKGLTLNLIKYTGKIKETQTIVGTGVIDHNYLKNTVLLSEMCPKVRDDAVNIAESLNVEEFLQKRITTITAEPLAITASLKLFRPQPQRPLRSSPAILGFKQ